MQWVFATLGLAALMAGMTAATEGSGSSRPMQDDPVETNWVKLPAKLQEIREGISLYTVPVTTMDGTTVDLLLDINHDGILIFGSEMSSDFLSDRPSYNVGLPGDEIIGPFEVTYRETHDYGKKLGTYGEILFKGAIVRNKIQFSSRSRVVTTEGSDIHAVKVAEKGRKLKNFFEVYSEGRKVDRLTTEVTRGEKARQLTFEDWQKVSFSGVLGLAHGLRPFYYRDLEFESRKRILDGNINFIAIALKHANERKNEDSFVIVGKVNPYYYHREAGFSPPIEIRSGEDHNSWGESERADFSMDIENAPGKKEGKVWAGAHQFPIAFSSADWAISLPPVLLKSFLAALNPRKHKKPGFTRRSDDDDEHGYVRLPDGRFAQPCGEWLPDLLLRMEDKQIIRTHSDRLRLGPVTDLPGYDGYCLIAVLENPAGFSRSRFDFSANRITMGTPFFTSAEIHMYRDGSKLFMRMRQHPHVLDPDPYVSPSAAEAWYGIGLSQTTQDSRRVGGL